MSHVFWAFSTLFILSMGTALLIYGLVQGSLRELLTAALRLPAATTFYLRSLLLILLLLALAAAFKSSFEADKHFMEYVWAIAGRLAGQFEYVAGYFVAYLVLITILARGLKPKE